MSVRLKCLAPRPMASLRLVCLPFAGAGAGAFRGWAEALPPHIEAFAAQLPGREDRLGESPATDWDAILADLAEQLAALPRQPLAIFGHSLGALVGLELARLVAREQSAPLAHLFVSARPWPGAAQVPRVQDAGADDEALLASMRRHFGALPDSLSHPDIRDVVMPALRADLGLLDRHRYQEATPLPCPLTVFAGRDDPCAAAASLDAWRNETAGDCSIHLLDAGHFYVESHRHELAAEIARRLPDPARW